ncbi:hypothetical protein [Marinobacter metalliresistant]|uniref:Molecular chaperone DnaJ n=1 Tax=Marinobacter metalliresistant TaxID=2961995 RepID=A0ABZ2W5X4_9GAMM
MSRIKPQKSRKNSKAAKTAAQPLQREWQRIVNLKQKNERLEQELEAFMQQCMDALRHDEAEMMDAILQQTKHLAGFLSRKSLAQWQKVELLEWIHQNILQVTNSPFCDQAQLLDLSSFFEGLQQSLGPGEPPPTPEQPTNKPKPGQCHHQRARQDTATEDMFEDLFADFEQEPQPEPDRSAGPDAETDDSGYWEQLFEDFIREEEEAEQARQSDTNGLRQLLKKSSINNLFRQLARVLHPDREQDESRKAQRHEQMSQLLKAREQNDLFTLFSLYEEHMGQSPLESLSEDTDNDLLALLKAHTQELREQQETLIYADPLRGLLYDHFYDKKPKSRARNLQQYCAKLRKIIDNERQITRSITSVATLKPYLEARYNQMPPIDFL